MTNGSTLICDKCWTPCDPLYDLAALHLPATETVAEVCGSCRKEAEKHVDN